MDVIPWLLLPVAAAAGWLIATRSKPVKDSTAQPEIDKQYQQGLNFLTNEQPDKAIEALVNVVDADHETVNTKLVLGALFRRRGEVERAIKIHENVIAGTGLNPLQRESAQIELGTDFLKAGMFDRAEQIFSDLVVGGSSNQQVFLRLQEIYEQQRDWQLAIHISDRLQTLDGQGQHPKIAQYHCELAETLIAEQQWREANIEVNKAITRDSRCVRAILLSGDLALQAEKFASAELRYRQVFEINRSFAALAYDKLFSLYAEQNNLQGLLNMIAAEGLDKDAAARLVLLRIYMVQHDEQAIKALLQNELSRKNAAPKLVKHYLEFMRDSSSGDVQQAFGTLHRLLDNELSNYRSFRCLSCGYDTNTLFWLCPTCRKWGTVKINRNMNLENG